MSEYILDLRKTVGHRPLLQVGASVIVVDSEGRILLQKRRDNGLWGYAGGSVELFANELELFVVFSGKILHYTYPNGDEVSNIDIVYLCRSYSGEITPQASEVSELRFFSASEMPPENELTPPNRPVLKRYIESLAEC